MVKLSVVGSINTDFVFTSENLPKPSETIMGTGFAINYGGKGANVSVAAARLGAKVKLFGAIGDDVFSKENIKNLKAQKVDISNVLTFKGVLGGAAGINVGSGTNSITVVSGANQKYDKNLITKNLKHILDSNVVATQLETNIEGVEHLIDECNKHNVPLVFNPSPMIDLKEELLQKCAYVIVNEVEIKQLPNYQSNEQMLQYYNGKLILTTGANGVYYYDNGVNHIPSLKVESRNTTGAGDTFLAAFSLSIASNKSVGDACRFANICAGLKVTKEGTQTGMPTKTEVEQYIKTAETK
jgi:ribokinase